MKVEGGKGHTVGCGVPYLPCNGKCGAIRESPAVTEEHEDPVTRDTCVQNNCSCVEGEPK